jgi:hypothetical protein
VALGTIAADYATKCLLYGAEAAYLVGLAMYAIPTVRNLLILWLPRLDSDRRLRGMVCAIAFVIWATIAVAANIAKSAPLDLIMILPFLGFGLASIGEISNDMPTRRRFIFTIGCLMSVFAVETQAWGLLAKGLISDVGASLYYMRYGVSRG